LIIIHKTPFGVSFFHLILFGDRPSGDESLARQNRDQNAMIIAANTRSAGDIKTNEKPRKFAAGWELSEPLVRLDSVVNFKCLRDASHKFLKVV
jgi:hypothetical protein